MNKELIIKTSNNHNKKLKEFYKSHLSYYPINWKDNLGKHTLLFAELFLIINILQCYVCMPLPFLLQSTLVITEWINILQSYVLYLLTNCSCYGLVLISALESSILYVVILPDGSSSSPSSIRFILSLYLKVRNYFKNI